VSLRIFSSFSIGGPDGNTSLVIRLKCFDISSFLCISVRIIYFSLLVADAFGYNSPSSSSSSVCLPMRFSSSESLLSSSFNAWPPGPRVLGSSGPRNLGSSGPRVLGSSGPRVLGSSGPLVRGWVLGSLGPWVLGSLGPWVLGSLGPWVLGSLGPWVLGSLGPWVLGSLGPWVLG
jgi:hypothetical protein